MNEAGTRFYKINQSTQDAIQISEETFYRESDYIKSTLEALRRSVYPTQANDYLLLQHGKKTYPVDYKLVPFVRFLWKQNLQPLGWNQPDSLNPGFVTVAHSTKKGNSSLLYLTYLFNGLPVVYLDFSSQSPDDFSDLPRIDSLIKKGKIVFALYSTFLSVSFTESLLESLSKHLHLSLNRKRLPGRGILSAQEIQSFQKRN